MRRVYEGIPLKRELFSVVKLFWVPSERVFRHLHFQGTFKVEIDESHSFLIRHHGFQIENQIFWAGLRGGWEKKSVAIWIELCSAAKVILDIGANTGLYALIAKSVNPGSEVVALEPVERVYKKLCQNNEMNGYDITCLQKAASNRDGVAIIYDTKTDHVLSVTVGKNLSREPVETVPTTVGIMRLDNLIDSLSLDRIDLMKIDVETHEPQVLEGLGAYLERYRPTMLIEILSDEIGKNVEALVEGKGYRYFNIDDASGSIRQMPHISKSDYFNYLLCNDETIPRLKSLYGNH